MEARVISDPGSGLRLAGKSLVQSSKSAWGYETRLVLMRVEAMPLFSQFSMFAIRIGLPASAVSRACAQENLSLFWPPERGSGGLKKNDRPKSKSAANQQALTQLRDTSITSQGKDTSCKLKSPSAALQRITGG